MAGHDDLAMIDGALLPRLIRPESTLRLCLEARIGEDVSEWRGRFVFDAAEQGGVPLGLSRISGGSVCFETPVPALPDGPSRVRLQIVDEYDGAVVLSDHITVLVDRQNRAARAARDDYRAAMRKLGQIPAADYAAELGRVSRVARAAELPLLAARADAVAAFALRRDGSPGSREAADRLLRTPGPWFGHPLAAPRTADWHYERGALAVAADGNPAEAWFHYSEADREYNRVASPKRIHTAMKRAEILHRTGRAAEAVELIDATLERCADCDAAQRGFARNSLAFMVAMDPRSLPEALDQARQALTLAIEELPPDAHPIERANLLINRALIEARRGVVDEEGLAEAQRIITRSLAGEARRARELEPWIPLARARAALQRGDYTTARRHCRGSHGSSRRLAAARATCLAEAWAGSGEIDRAQDHISRALEAHGDLDASLDGAGLARRAHDIEFAAWVALEQGETERAWELLEQLDRDAASLPAGGSGAGLSRQRLLDALRALHRPAGLSARELRESQTIGVRSRLTPVDRPVSRTIAEPGSRPRLRYARLRDELVILGRRPSGRVAVLRRTPVDGAAFSRWTHQVERALRAGELADAGWRELAGRYSALLIPPAAALPDEIEVIAHGELQRIPLAALPHGDGWLGDRTQVSYVVSAAVGNTRDSDGGLVFVTDPTGDLAGAARSRSHYRRLFPDSTQIFRDQATVASVLAALPGARWLHVDGHAEPDPGYPELSRLELADDDLFVEEVLAAGDALEFVNLSGCRTGAGRISVGVGRYGMGGSFIRQGASHVVASRADLFDDLVTEFNGRLYEALGQGAALPTAFAG